MQYKPNWDDREEIVNSILTDFSERIGVDILPDIITKTIYTPKEWKELDEFVSESGLGLSHKMSQIGGLRPANFDEKFKNMFYVGASTVPRSRTSDGDYSLACQVGADNRHRKSGSGHGGCTYVERIFNRSWQSFGATYLAHFCATIRVRFPDTNSSTLSD